MQRGKQWTYSPNNIVVDYVTYSYLIIDKENLHVILFLRYFYGTLCIANCLKLENTFIYLPHMSLFSLLSKKKLCDHFLVQKINFNKYYFYSWYTGKLLKYFWCLLTSIEPTLIKSEIGKSGMDIWLYINPVNIFHYVVKAQCIYRPVKRILQDIYSLILDPIFQ